MSIKGGIAPNRRRGNFRQNPSVFATLALGYWSICHSGALNETVRLLKNLRHIHRLYLSPALKFYLVIVGVIFELFNLQLDSFFRLLQIDHTAIQVVFVDHIFLFTRFNCFRNVNRLNGPKDARLFFVSVAWNVDFWFAFTWELINGLIKCLFGHFLKLWQRI